MQIWRRQAKTDGVIPIVLTCIHVVTKKSKQINQYTMENFGLDHIWLTNYFFIFLKSWHKEDKPLLYKRSHSFLSISRSSGRVCPRESRGAARSLRGWFDHPMPSDGKDPRRGTDPSPRRREAPQVLRLQSGLHGRPLSWPVQVWGHI